MGHVVPWDGWDAREVYRELEHPADRFLEVWAPDLEGLLVRALYALYTTMVEPRAVVARDTLRLHAEGIDPSELLRAVLAEALYRFDAGGFVAAGATARVAQDVQGWSGDVDLAGETLDRSRHTTLSEVKAVTYHRLSVRPDDGSGWHATFILDL